MARKRAGATEEALGAAPTRSSTEVGLASSAIVLLAELSVADSRRLEFAKALSLRPQLLLLDE